MFTRKLFKWKITMLGPGHKQQDENFNTYWSPEKVSKDEILLAASAQFTGRASRGLPAPVVWRALDAVLTDA